MQLTVMKECIGKNFILDGKLLDCGMFDNSFVCEGESIYEVIKMRHGDPVFFEDHMDRLGKSLAFRNREPVAGKQALKRDILILAGTVQDENVNLKIVFNYRDNSASYIVYFIESVYPDERQYLSGVKGVLYYAERKDPESKVIDVNLRSMISAKLGSEGAYEALLVNKNNDITEGSRSNIFFIRGNEIITAPDNLVLNGITRKNLLEICMGNGIAVSFRCVKPCLLGEYESVFLTGTSPVVLPFRNIDNFYFNVSHPYISALRELYMRKAEESIRVFRKDQS